MRGNKYIKRELVILLFFQLLVLLNFQSNAQEVYATQVTDNSTDVQNPGNIVDTNKQNYATVSNLLSLLSNSHVRVRFPVSGKAGDAINFTVQATGQVLGAGLLNNTTVRLYDSAGNNVHTSTGSSVLELSLLSTADSTYNIRYVSNPSDTFKFKEARIDFSNLLNVNLLNEFRILGVFYQVPCPPVYADGVYAFGTNGLLTGFVTNPGNAVDNNNNNYATLVTPLNILSLLPPAYLELEFDKPFQTGSFVAFTVGQQSALLSASLLDNIEITVYDENGVAREVNNSFTQLDLRLLSGTTDRYTLGFTTQSGTYRISRLRIELESVLSLLQDFRVYNAFHYDIDRAPVAVTASRSTNMCVGDSVVLTAEEVPHAAGYLWNTSDTSRSITITQGGVYSVTVLDSFACSRKSLDIRVTVNATPQVKIVGDTVLCGARPGMLETSLPYSTYLWSDNSTGDTLNITDSGNYFITVTDVNGCVGSDSVAVGNNVLDIASTITNTTCDNTNTGSIDLNITGGSNSYSYLWSNGNTTDSIGSLESGIYTVIVSDNNEGCAYNKAYTISSDNSLAIKTAVVNTTACGEDDGRIAINVVGGSGQYTYAWSNSETTKDITDVEAGIYTVNVTDAISGCQLSKTTTVSDANSGLILTPSATPSSSCSAPNGSASVSVAGGSGNYTYTWSNNQTTQSISNLSVGKYHVLVHDQNLQCNNAVSVNVDNSASLQVNGSISATGCGLSTGSITTSVTGGSNSYSYSWSDGGTGANRQNLLAGTYIATVTDNVTGCTGEGVFVIGESTAPSVAVSITRPSCATNGNGAIDITTAGNYMYAWSNGATTQDISGLSSGTYTVTITDTATNCIANYQAVLEAYGQIDIKGDAFSNTACANAANGAIDITVEGGMIPYTYAWSNSDTTQDIDSLNGGVYTLTVTDSNSCSASIAVPVVTDSSKLLSVSVDTIDLASCTTTANASVVLNVTGGVQPYSYNWSNSAITKDLTNVLPGNYNVTVTDGVGCTQTLSVAVGIDSVNMLMITVDSTAFASCSGSKTGAIYVTASGGQAPYTYKWSDNSTSEDLINVSAGAYSLTITDDLGCTAQEDTSVQVHPSLAVTVTLDSTTKASCQASSDGSIYVSVSNGASPYTYSWSNNATTQDLLNVPAGSYTLNVTDNNGCPGQLNTTLEIDTANRLMAAASNIVDANCQTSKTGGIDVDVTGGKLPLTYNWSNGTNAQDLSLVVPGAYTLNITDAAGCTTQLTATVGIDTTNMLMVSVDSIVNVGCTDPNSGKLFISTVGGISPYTYSWNDGSSQEDRAGLAGGGYTVTVTDFVGCTDTASANISNAALIVVEKNVSDVSCFGSADGSITLDVTGGVATLAYNWSNGATTSTVTDLGAGQYSVAISDAETNCTINDTFTISEPAELKAVIFVTNDDCFEQPAGKIEVNASGGTPPYSYQVEGSLSGSIADNLQQGSYSITITDNNGCDVSTTEVVDKDECDFDINVHNVITPNGDGMNDSWRIDGLEFYPNNEVLLFNKWGDVVYQQKAYDGKWGGISTNGDALPDGTYYYLVQLNEANKAGGKNQFTGYLMIQR